jgi:catechol 2,3-dioxygenase-like lactoylglutathione lyase family enzyme
MNMFSHICLGTNDLAESIIFYDQVMSVLGVSRQDIGDTYAGYGSQEDIGSGVNCLFIGNTFNGELATAGNGVNIALLAQTREQVDQFHQIALENGGYDEGAPGLRDVHPHFYAAYVRDPTGNKLVVVCHSEQKS